MVDTFSYVSAWLYAQMWTGIGSEEKSREQRVEKTAQGVAEIKLANLTRLFFQQCLLKVFIKNKVSIEPLALLYIPLHNMEQEQN